MSDISLCKQSECPKAVNCLRFTTPPGEHWQSYVSPKFNDDGCRLYLMKSKSVLRRLEVQLGNNEENEYGEA